MRNKLRNQVIENIWRAAGEEEQSEKNIQSHTLTGQVVLEVGSCNLSNITTEKAHSLWFFKKGKK